mmetsp:Transcript_4427/g.16690  ORF Transcript_4427/g.16690 Transcript_4427/m.16690 type:complete len:502 (-) Transcript_4427:3039-4544(-)
MPRVKICFPKENAQEVRRWQIRSFPSLKQHVESALGRSITDGRLEFLDDENDWCVLSSVNEWKEACLTLNGSPAAQQKVLHLKYSPKGQKQREKKDALKKKSSPSDAQTQKCDEQTGYSMSLPLGLGSLPQKAMHQVVNLEEYLKRLVAEQHMQKLREQRVAQCNTSRANIQKSSTVSSQEIAPPETPKSDNAQSTEGLSNLIPFEDFLKDFGGKIAGFLHQKPSSPKSALPQKSSQGQRFQVQPKTRSHSDHFISMVPRIILHPKSNNINGHANKPTLQRSQLTTTASSDLPLSKIEGFSSHNLENIHKEERDEFKQMEEKAQTPKDEGIDQNQQPKPQAQSEELKRYLKDPNLEDLTSSDLDEMLNEAYEEEEAKQASQAQPKVATPASLSAAAKPYIPRTRPQTPINFAMSSGSLTNDEQAQKQRQQQLILQKEGGPHAVGEDEAQGGQYAHSMSLLKNIGFDNDKLNAHLLQFHKGNLNDAIHALIRLSQEEEKSEH